MQDERDAGAEDSLNQFLHLLQASISEILSHCTSVIIGEHAWAARDRSVHWCQTAGWALS